jgi:hypothetical protein
MKTNACVQPRTMMVKSLHALSAIHAMPASPRSYDFTVRTKRSAIENFQQIHKLNTFVFDISRILTSNNRICKKHNKVYKNRENVHPGLLVWTNYKQYEEHTNYLKY